MQQSLMKYRVALDGVSLQVIYSGMSRYDPLAAAFEGHLLLLIIISQDL